MAENCFSLEMAVRDYECDLQGVVNNAVYQNYLEHARHEYLKSIGIDFAALAAQKINLVVVRVEIDYKASLTSGERLWSRCGPSGSRQCGSGFAKRSTGCRSASSRSRRW